MVDDHLKCQNLIQSKDKNTNYLFDSNHYQIPNRDREGNNKKQEGIDQNKLNNDNNTSL